MSFASGDEVPQISTPKPRRRPLEFLAPSPKRLFQHYLPKPEIRAAIPQRCSGVFDALSRRQCQHLTLTRRPQARRGGKLSSDSQPLTRPKRKLTMPIIELAVYTASSRSSLKAFQYHIGAFLRGRVLKVYRYLITTTRGAVAWIEDLTSECRRCRWAHQCRMWVKTRIGER